MCTMTKRQKKRMQRRRGQTGRQRRTSDENIGSWLPTKWLSSDNGRHETGHYQGDGFDLVAEGSRQVREKLEDVVMRTKGFFRKTELEVDFPSSSPNSMPISNKVEDIFSKTQDLFECDASWGDDDESEASDDHEDALSPIARRRKSHNEVVSRLASIDDDESYVSSGITDKIDDFCIEDPDDDASDIEEHEGFSSLFEDKIDLPTDTSIRRKRHMLGASVPNKQVMKQVPVSQKEKREHRVQGQDPTMMNALQQQGSISYTEHLDNRFVGEHFLSTRLQAFLPSFADPTNETEVLPPEPERSTGYTHLQDLSAPPRRHYQNPQSTKKTRTEEETISGLVWQTKMLNLYWLRSYTSTENVEETTNQEERENPRSRELQAHDTARRGCGIGGEIRRKMVQRSPRKFLAATPRADDIEKSFIGSAIKSNIETLESWKGNSSDFHEDSASLIDETYRPTQIEPTKVVKPAQLVRDRFSKARQTLEKSGRQRSISLEPLNSKAKLISKGIKHRSISMQPLTPRSKMADKLKRIRAGPKFDIINRRLRGDDEETEIEFQSPKASEETPKLRPLFESESTFRTCETQRKDVNRSNTFTPIEAAKVIQLPCSPRSESAPKSIKVPKARISYAISPPTETLSSQEKRPKNNLAPISANNLFSRTTDGNDSKQEHLKTDLSLATKTIIVSPKPLRSLLPPGGTTYQDILASSRRGIQVANDDGSKPCVTSPRESRDSRLKRLQQQCKDFPSPKPVSAARRFTFDAL